MPKANWLAFILTKDEINGQLISHSMEERYFLENFLIKKDAIEAHISKECELFGEFVTQGGIVYG